MGRGRQRAKQRKVARDLKYFSPDTDYAALERELTGHSRDVNFSRYDQDNSDEEYDAYAEYAAKYDIDDDDESATKGYEEYLTPDTWGNEERR